MQRDNVNRTVVLLLTLLVSAVFLAMIRQFLMAIFLAGIFSALAHPLYRGLENRLGGRRGLASAATLVLLIALVLIPLGTLLGMVTAQAFDVGQSVKIFLEEHITDANTVSDPNTIPDANTLSDPNDSTDPNTVTDPNGLAGLLDRLPIPELVLDYKQEILEKAGKAVGTISTFFINTLSDVAMGTIQFFFTVFILLYTMFFFLMDGDKLLNKILLYLPLEDKDERRLLERFTSVARATIKGTVVIGLIQGTMGGLAFAVVGLRGAVFWGAVMAVASVIPGVGTALVWVPAVVILVTGGHLLKAVGLALFCALAVGGIDNILRPILVGKDTKIHELLILFATLGGIMMFGFVGFIIGPIIAALFVTAWDIYGMVFHDVLPPVAPAKPVRPLKKRLRLKKDKPNRKNTKAKD